LDGSTWYQPLAAAHAAERELPAPRVAVGRSGVYPPAVERPHVSIRRLAIHILPRCLEIGSRLIEAGLERCRGLGYRYVVVLGHPACYSPFEFTRASRLALTIISLRAQDALAAEAKTLDFEGEI